MFRDLKNASREAYRRSDFMIGVAIVDRIASIIDAVRSARIANRRLKQSFSKEPTRNWKLSLNPSSYDRQVNLVFYPGL